MDRIYGVLFGLLLAGIFAFSRWYALKTGIAPGRGWWADRDKNPLVFKISVEMDRVFVFAGVALAVASAVGLLPVQP